MSNIEKNRGANYISNDGTEKVEIQTLDSWVKNNAIKKIDFIKIDTEGYEYNVLQGSRETLKKYEPKLFFEIDIDFLERNSVTWGEIYCFLQDLGYTCISTSNGVRIGKDWNNTERHTDIYAFICNEG